MKWQILNKSVMNIIWTRENFLSPEYKASENARVSPSGEKGAVGVQRTRGGKNSAVKWMLTLTIYSLKFSRPFYFSASIFRASILRAPLDIHYSRPSNFRAPCLLRAPLIFAHPKILMKILIVFKVRLFHISNPICMVCTTRNQWIAEVE